MAVQTRRAPLRRAVPTFHRLPPPPSGEKAWRIPIVIERRAGPTGLIYKRQEIGLWIKTLGEVLQNGHGELP